MPHEMLITRHPDEGCYQTQTELLLLGENPAERARLAQMLRCGNTIYSGFVNDASTYYSVILVVSPLYEQHWINRSRNHYIVIALEPIRKVGNVSR